MALDTKAQFTFTVIPGFSKQPPPCEDIHLEKTLIDAKIREHEQAIVQLRRRRNGLAPVCRFSRDVLLSIFQYLQNETIDPITSLQNPFVDWEEYFYVNGKSYKCQYKSELAWIPPVTHVCAHWRASALSMPKLWTRISFMKPAWIPEMLSRSLSLPLTIIFYQNGITAPRDGETKLAVLDNAFIHTLQQIWHRTAHLDLSLPSEAFTEDLFGILRTCSEGVLQACKLKASGRAVTNLPIDLLEKSAHSLQHVSFHNCSFQGPTDIAFTGLSTFFLSDNSERTAALLDHLSFPPTSFVTIRSLGTYSADTFSCFQPFVRRFWDERRAAGKFVRSIDLSLTRWRSSRDSTNDDVLGIHLEQDMDKETRGHNGLLLILEQFWDTPRGVSQTILNLIAPVSLDRVVDLAVEVDLCSFFWGYLAAACANVMDIALCRISPRLFLKLLDHASQFARLRTLSFHGASFNGECRASLKECLQYRFQRKIPIQNVHFYRVDGVVLDDPLLKAIKPFVGEVKNYKAAS